MHRCMKTIERAHSPKNLWEKVELPENKEQAIAMCNHWGKRCQEIYEYVMGTLLTEPKSE